MPPHARRRTRRLIDFKSQHEGELNIVALMDAFTIILVFLIKSYTSDPTAITQDAQLRLPMSNSHLAVSEAVPLVVTQEAVMVNDKRVLQIQSGVIAPQDKQDAFLVPALYQALQVEAERQKAMGRYNDQVQFNGLLLVVADKRVPFRTLTEVLYTAGKAQFGNYKFAVVKNDL